MQWKEPIEPQDPLELRDPKDGEPKERSRGGGDQAEGRKCHRVSFANREERGTSREEEEGEARIHAEGMVKKDSGRGGWREVERRKGKEAGGIA